MYCIQLDDGFDFFYVQFTCLPYLNGTSQKTFIDAVNNGCKLVKRRAKIKPALVVFAQNSRTLKSSEAGSYIV